jgi:undecaprenyl-diphosphatase
MNYDLLHTINGLSGHSAFLDNLMTFSAKYLIFALFALLVVVCVPYVQRRDWASLVAAGAALVLAFALGLVAGKLIHEVRPFQTHPNLHVVVQHAPGQSFPSDHATASFAIAFVLLLLLASRWGWLALAGALLIGFARVYDDIHYPGDILGSAIVAAIAVGIVYALRRPVLARIAPRQAALAGHRRTGG